MVTLWLLSDLLGVMSPPMAIWTKSYRIGNHIFTAFRERFYVMDFKIRRVIHSTVKGSRIVTVLTVSICTKENLSYYIGIAHKGRRHNLDFCRNSPSIF